MGNFNELLVWQKAKELAVAIYKITKEEHISKDFGLRDQMRRAAVSIPSNIAEGDELGSNRQSIRHFYIARGSAAELQTLIIIASDIGYLKAEESEVLINECKLIAVMLSKLIMARSK